jgi:hypothetical protein
MGGWLSFRSTTTSSERTGGGSRRRDRMLRITSSLAAPASSASRLRPHPARRSALPPAHARTAGRPRRRCRACDAAGQAPVAGSSPGAARRCALASCRADLIRRDSSAARWADEECRTNWQKVMASGPAADMLLAVLPGAGSGKPSLTMTKQRASGVRWAGRANPPALATGTLGQLEVAIGGSSAPATVSVNWAKVGGEIPYDIAGALRLRQIAITEMSCEKIGAGAGSRTYAGTSTGRSAVHPDRRPADRTTGAHAKLLHRHYPPGRRTSAARFDGRLRFLTIARIAVDFAGQGMTTRSAEHRMAARPPGRR